MCIEDIEEHVTLEGHEGQTVIRQSGSQFAQAPRGGRLPHRRAGGYGGRPRRPERRKSRCVSPAHEAAAPGYWFPPLARPKLAPHFAGWDKDRSDINIQWKRYISSDESFQDKIGNSIIIYSVLFQICYLLFFILYKSKKYGLLWCVFVLLFSQLDLVLKVW